MSRNLVFAFALGAAFCSPVRVLAAPAPPISPPHAYSAAQLASLRALIDRLAKRPETLLTDPEELVHLDWSKEWRP